MKITSGCYFLSPPVPLVFVIFVMLVTASDETQKNRSRKLSDEAAYNEYTLCDARAATVEETIEFARVVNNWVDSNGNWPLSTVYITTHFNIITDGSNGTVTANQIEQNLANLNEDFLPYNFQFVQGSPPAYYDNPLWFHSARNSEADREMKSLLRRGGAHTLNVYVGLAKNADGDSRGGYATFAQDYCDHGDQDGVYINYKSLPEGEWEVTGRTLTHELGHWLNLFHTFQNGCDYPGDGIDDTPYHQLSEDRTCPLTRDTCPGDSFYDPVNNFMNYVDDECRTEFTSGQGQAMMAAWDQYRLNCDCGCGDEGDEDDEDDEGDEDDEDNEDDEDDEDDGSTDDVVVDVDDDDVELSSSGGRSLCFSPSTSLIVEGKGTVYMKDVDIGDKVLVPNSPNTATNKYQEVYAFGHRNAYAKANFLQISTSKSNQESPLEITREHLLMKQSSDGEVVAVRADSIEVGDYLIGSRGDVQLVTKVSSIVRRGLYSPLTKGGQIVVNGLQVSSYTATQDQNPEKFVVGDFNVTSHHFMSHAASAPYRTMCNVLGVTMELCEQRNEEGQLLFAAGADKLVHWIMEQAIDIQIVVMPLLLFSMIAFHVLEKVSVVFVLGTCFFPLMIWLYARKFIDVSCGYRYKKCGKGRF